MRNEIVFDLETKRAPTNGGGRSDLESLGISVVGIWSSGDGQYRTFREGDIATELKAILREADRLIGFFIRRFDLPVLQPYLDFDLAEIPVLDIFDEVTKNLGHRVSLASLAKATLGASKLGHGLDAISWYREGNWEQLEQYCLQDVKITKELFDFGRENGHVLFESYIDRKMVSVPVAWGMPEESEIRSMIERAMSDRKVLEIEYVSRENAGDGFRKTRKIEVQKLNGSEIEAYDHLRGDIRIFKIGRVFSARLLDETIRERLAPQSLFA